MRIVYIDTIAIAMHDTLWMTRNFYGVFRVVGDEAPDHRWHSYRLMNGRITHGEQFFSSTYPRLRYYPTTYYCLNSGIGLLLMNYPRRAQPKIHRFGSEWSVLASALSRRGAGPATTIASTR